MNSWAISSTKPVYSSMPALVESKTPLTIKAVCDPGAYVFLTPSPIAIAMGVEIAYPTARKYGVNFFLLGQGVTASREPRPKPSKGPEFRSGHCESEANKYRVEDDAEFKNEDGSNLRSILFVRDTAQFIVVRMGIMFAGVAQMVVARCVAMAPSRGNAHWEGMAFSVTIMDAVLRATKSGVAHSHEFDEEEHEDSHESYAFNPGVFRDYSCKAGISKGLIGRGKELRRVSYDAGSRLRA
ncbi:MAG: hypothetical protein Q9187_007396 [Circinaria calcarea]